MLRYPRIVDLHAVAGRSGSGVKGRAGHLKILDGVLEFGLAKSCNFWAVRVQAL